jgi:hypothetical protein
MNLTGQVAERYVRDAMALDPVSATLAGISGFDDQMADLTPDGFEARAELDRRTIAAIREVAPASEPEQVARAAMLERCRHLGPDARQGRDPAVPRRGPASRHRPAYL